MMFPSVDFDLPDRATVTGRKSLLTSHNAMLLHHTYRKKNLRTERHKRHVSDRAPNYAVISYEKETNNCRTSLKMAFANDELSQDQDS